MNDNNNANKYRKAIDGIDAGDGAKERMFANIRSKSAGQASAKTDDLSRVLKWALPIAACLVVILIVIVSVPGKRPSTPPDIPASDISSVTDFASETNETKSVATETTPRVKLELEDYREANNNGIFQSHYTDETLEFDLIELAKDYVQSEDSSKWFREIYFESGLIKAYPVYGTYLEPTNLAVYAFFKDGELIGTRTMTIDVSDETLITTDFDTEHDGVLSYNPFSDYNCFSVMNTTVSRYETYEILGFVFCDQGAKTIFIVGKEACDNYITYLYGSPERFRLVEPFETISEGRVAFADYFEKKEIFIQNNPQYRWNNKQKAFPNLNQYVNTDRNAISNPIYGYFLDDWIEVNLLDKDLNECKYNLYLITYHGQLVSEVVLYYDSDAAASYFDGNADIPVYERTAELGEDGKPIPMGKSMYEEFILAYKSEHGGNIPAAVIFDNGSYIAVDN